MTYGDVSLLKQADNWKELQSLIKESFDKLLKESEILFFSFYNKFPNWIHKIKFKTKKLWNIYNIKMKKNLIIEYYKTWYGYRPKCNRLKIPPGFIIENE